MSLNALDLFGGKEEVMKRAEASLKEKLNEKSLCCLQGLE